jgi:hypothetical protein
VDQGKMVDAQQIVHIMEMLNDPEIERAVVGRYEVGGLRLV